MFRRLIAAEPAVRLVTHTLYEATVAPLAIVKTKVSFADMFEFVSVKPTLVAPFNAALFIVIWPQGAFNVTPVDLLLACVTAPCAAAV